MDDENEEIVFVFLNVVQGLFEEDMFRIVDFFKVIDDVKDDFVFEFLGIFCRLVVVEFLRIVDFFIIIDEEIDDIMYVFLDIFCSLIVIEFLRIVEFFVFDDEIDGEGSGCESMDFEFLFVSYYMERMDFEGKDDSDDELVFK